MVTSFEVEGSVVQRTISPRVVGRIAEFVCRLSCNACNFLWSGCEIREQWECNY